MLEGFVQSKEIHVLISIHVFESPVILSFINNSWQNLWSVLSKNVYLQKCQPNTPQILWENLCFPTNAKTFLNVFQLWPSTTVAQHFLLWYKLVTT